MREKWCALKTCSTMFRAVVTLGQTKSEVVKLRSLYSTQAECGRSPAFDPRSGYLLKAPSPGRGTGARRYRISAMTISGIEHQIEGLGTVELPFIQISLKSINSCLPRILLYGPPGCGRLIAKAVANSIAKNLVIGPARPASSSMQGTGALE